MAVLAVAAVVAYAGLVGWRGVLLVADGRPVAVAFGLALLVFPVVGVAAVLAELRFGLRSARLADRLAAEGGLPEDVLPRRPSGRVVRAAADADFDRWQAEATAAPEDWRCWYRLALAYDAAGDRRRARGAARRAIALAGAGRAVSRTGREPGEAVGDPEG